MSGEYAYMIEISASSLVVIKVRELVDRVVPAITVNPSDLVVEQGVLIKANKDELKAYFLDSKGDFYQLASDYQNAITFYNNSLNYKHEPPYTFHTETLKKLKELNKKQAKNIYLH